MTFTLPDILFCIVIFQLLFTGSFLFTRPGARRIRHRLLGSFFLSVGLILTDNFLVIKKAWIFSPYLVSWGICLPLLFGPLLFLYTQSLLYRDFTLSRNKWLHFVPFGFFFLAFELFYILQDKQAILKMLNNIADRRLPVVLYWSSALVFGQYFIYMAATLQLIRKYKLAVRDNYSDPRYNNLRWLYSTIVFFSACMVLAAFNGFSRLTAWSQYYYLFFIVIIGLLFVFINRVLVVALVNPGIFGEMAAPPIAPSPASVLPPPASPAPDQEDTKRALEQIRKYMQDKKPYLDADLTLEQLATQLSLRPKFLSRLINESLHQHFFDLINSYRIEEAKRLLTNPPDKKITVLEVLYQCGFNSKSSFNTLFKRYTGKTPTDFREEQRDSDSAVSLSR
jgi:AraC-like DNA-binding protein